MTTVRCHRKFVENMADEGALSAEDTSAASISNDDTLMFHLLQKMNANMNKMSESLKRLHEVDHADDIASASKTAKHGLSKSDHSDSEDLLGGKSAEQAKNPVETAKIDH